MKRTLFSIVLVLMAFSLYAQEKKNYAGYYRASGGTHLILEADRTFCIIAYATLIQGTWTMEKGDLKELRLILDPENPEHSFELYGRYNPNISSGYKVKFNRFYKEETLIGEGRTDTMRRVFNRNPNCFESLYVYQFGGKVSSISFADIFLGSHSLSEPGARSTYSFSTGSNNDFIAVYHSSSEYYQKMSFDFDPTSAELVFNGEVGDFNKLKADDRLMKEINEIREMVKTIKRDSNKGFLFCNPSYRVFDESAMNMEHNYSFDISKNAYLSRLNYEKDEELYPEKKEDAYHSIGILYKYEKIAPSSIAVKPFVIKEQSLFIAACGD